MKNIDTTIDYEALLEEAKRVHKVYAERCDKHRSKYNARIDASGRIIGFPPAIKEELQKLYGDWCKWLNDNLKARGLHLKKNLMGAPIAIFAVLAGDEDAVCIAENT